MTTASQLFNTALSAWRRRQSFLKHGISEIPSTEIRHELSDDERQAVDELWGPVRYRPNYRWHEFFYGLTGTFDARYVPNDVHFISALPALNNANLRLAWEDKALYARRFPNTRFPDSIGYCIHGRLHDGAGRATDAATLIETLQELPEVLVKPTLDTYCGKGVEVFDPAGLNEDALMAYCDARQGNCVFQVPIRQHAITAALNPSSCNIIRVNTLRVESGYHVLNSTIRFGDPGNRTDVSFDAQGIERLNLLGVTADGRLMSEAYTAQGERTPLEKFGLQAGIELPGITQAFGNCLDLHAQLPHFDLVAFDVAIDEMGDPIVVEINLGTPGAAFYQFMHGPFYGPYTEYVIELAAHSKSR